MIIDFREAVTGLHGLRSGVLRSLLAARCSSSKALLSLEMASMNPSNSPGRAIRPLALGSPQRFSG